MSLCKVRKGLEHLVDDRRLAERRCLKIPMLLRMRTSENREEEVESENVPRPVFIQVNLPLDMGAALDLLLETPEEISGAQPVQWMYSGHVARVECEKSSQEKRGFGAEFDFCAVSHTTRRAGNPRLDCVDRCR